MEAGKIIYVFDPLCGWCYGFTPLLNRLREELSPKYSFDIIAGGMILGNLIGPVSQRRDFLKKRIPDIERITGVKFGDKYLSLLELGTYVSNSEPPCNAFNVFCSFRPDLAFPFSEEIHHLYYREGRDLNSVRGYLDIAEKYEINKHAFMERFEDEKYKKITFGIFDRVSKWEIKGFPSLVLEQEDTIRVFMRGYTDYEKVISGLEQSQTVSGQEPDF